MSCKCTPTEPVLPTVEDDCALSAPIAQPVTNCCSDPESLSSSTSEGSILASSFTDAACANEDVTILGRVGNRLVRFFGTGFIAITNGKASIVDSVPLKVKDLWHRWWKPTVTSTPILGEPLSNTYDVVADSQGNVHGIKGLADEDSIRVWNHTDKVFETKGLGAVPKSVTGLLPRAAGIELTGYAPIADDGEITETRQLSALDGTGLVYLTEVDTVEAACDCVGVLPVTPNKVSVANKLEFPNVDGTYTLKVVVTGGEPALEWTPDA